MHADHIRLAKVDEWSIPKTATGQPRRRAIYVAPPPSDSNNDESESPDSELETPQNKLIKYARREREDSGDEDDIPLMELATRLRERKRRGKEDNQGPEEHREFEENAYASDDRHSLSWADSEATVGYDQSDSMIVQEVTTSVPPRVKPEAVRSKSRTRSRGDQKLKVKTLLNAIARMF